MKVTDGETEALGTSKTAAGSVHANRRRRKGVVGGEGKGSPVLAVVVGCSGWPSEDVVPF